MMTITYYALPNGITLALAGGTPRQQAYWLYREIRRGQGWSRHQARTVVAFLFGYSTAEGGIYL